jgi:hypothetical protein
MMRSKDYGVEVIRAYEFKRVGQVIFPPALMRDRLVNAGFVRRVAAPVVRVGADIVREDAKAFVGVDYGVNQKKPKLRLK